MYYLIKAFQQPIPAILLLIPAFISKRSCRQTPKNVLSC